MDLNHGPLGYEPSELPSCSTPRRLLQAAVIYFIRRQGIVKSACRSAHSGLRGSCCGGDGRVFAWLRAGWLPASWSCVRALEALVGVCRGMRGRLDVGGLALLPVVFGGLCMSWHTLPAVSGEFRMVTVGLPHVAYVSACVSPQMLVDLGGDVGDLRVVYVPACVVGHPPPCNGASVRSGAGIV